MINIPHEPEGFLKWIIGFLIVLWILWYFLGGPQSYEAQKGPFIMPPSPVGTGEIYGPK
jgi:hypothetical protein